MGLFDRLRSAFQSSNQAMEAKLQRVDPWLAALTTADARALALPVLANPKWFAAVRANGAVELPPGLPESVHSFFSEYQSVVGAYSDLRLVAAEIGPADDMPGTIRIGWEDEHVQLCVVTGDAAIQQIANDVPADEAREGTLISPWHAVLRMAAVLEYIPVPEAAA